MAHILDITTAVPKYSVSNNEFVSFYSKAFEASNSEYISKKLTLFMEKTKIRNRHSCIPDFKGLEHELFIDRDYNQPVEKRMAVFNEKILPLATSAIDKLFMRNNVNPSEVTHLITVSCTGVLAPGLEFLVAEHYGMPYVEKLALNFLGCYAAVKALKHANYIAEAIPSASVLIVCAELCSLHFNPSIADEDVAANLLFADGAAAVMVCGNESRRSKNKVCLTVDAIGSVHLPHTADLMTWHISSDAFNMHLNKNIVKAIKENIFPAVNDFLCESESSPDYWAIHPGGIAILEAIRQSLDLTSADIQDSLHVLANYGNMSSSTILFVLNRILENLNNEMQGEDKKIFTCAFGPGLSIEMIGFSASVQKQLSNPYSFSNILENSVSHSPVM